jgi:hypothetical protein
MFLAARRGPEMKEPAPLRGTGRRQVLSLGFRYRLLKNGAKSFGRGKV